MIRDCVSSRLFAFVVGSRLLATKTKVLMEDLNNMMYDMNKLNSRYNQEVDVDVNAEMDSLALTNCSLMVITS